VNRKEARTLLKNAIANVVRGSAAAVVAIILPIFLTRLMLPAAFSAWSLVLQISAYMGYLDFGIQTAVGRFVAHANEKGDAGHRDRIVGTSFAILSVAGLFGLCATAGLAPLLPHIFRQLPTTMVRGSQIALLLAGSSLAIGLPASVFNGIFIGYQRNEIPAAIIGGSRILGAILLVLVVAHGGGLAQMGATTAAVNLASYALQYLMYRKVAPDLLLSRRFVSRAAVRELFDYCLSLSVWSFAILLITGLDVLLVGYFQFDAVAPYAVAASLITFLGGLQNAIFSAMIPSTAVMHARGEPAELGRVVITATRYGTFLLLLVGLPLILFARRILTVWVGARYADAGTHILEILVAANILRLALTPYTVALIGSGQQRLVMLTPLLEGFTNLLFSIGLGYLFGAIGVAIGTLIGSLVGVTSNFIYNMPRTIGLRFGRSDYLRNGLLRPAICGLPFVVFAILVRRSESFVSITTGVSLVAMVALTVFLVWRWGLMGSERKRLLARHFAPQM
jgi:O-antigen/teichoic acid export membrane protein